MKDRMQLVGRAGNVAIALLVLVAGSSTAEAPDWETLAATETVEVITEDEDGSCSR